MNLRLMELKDVIPFMASRLDGDFEIYCSAEAMDYFRELPIVPLDPPRKISFHAANLPTRFLEGAERPVFMVDEDKITSEWLTAPLEVISGSCFGGAQSVLWKRQEYTP